jgi:tetratricopeptide (TPR) repeat protein
MKTITACAFVSVLALHAPLAAAGQLGTVTFPTSSSARAQPVIERGVALLHSFQYDEAAVAFDEAARHDSRCSMCHWGKAMVLYHQLWDWPTPETMARGRQEIRTAQRIGARTARERAYIASAATFFQGGPRLTHADRIRAYSRSVAELHRDYPTDADAAAFYALSLIALANENVDRLTNLRRALDVLEPLLRALPNHPGIAHYLIHAADRPELAQRGLPAARVYADIAPDSSHALHMPSHIFVRLGLWEEVIALNVRAAASGAHAAMEHRGDYTYQIHAMDFLRYAYLQRGMESKARTLHDELSNVPAAPESEKLADRAYFAGRTAVELHRWSEAASLPVPNLDPSWLADAFWARTIGAARMGDVDAARENLVKLRESTRALQAGRDAGAQLESEMPIAQQEAEAWVALAEGDNDRGLTLLRNAAERESADGGESVAVPAREMRADALLEMNRFAESLDGYASVLREAPNRFNALLGAARAADALGMAAQARDYYQRLIAVAAADADRPEVETARALLAK